MDAFFLRGTAGPLFSLHYKSSVGDGTCAALFVPPFGEEMNKSRRMTRLQVDELNRLGIDALLVDPYGTGDSAGDFSDARVDIWLDDLLMAYNWLRDSGYTEIVIWALRLGALIAFAAARSRIPDAARFAFWQPATDGHLAMTQFLRMRVVADNMHQTDKASVKGLQKRIDDGETLEVGGYSLAPALVHGIQQLRMTDLVPEQMERIAWYEVSAAEGSRLSLPSTRILEMIEGTGTFVDAACIAGPPFWTTTEIAVSDALISRTASFFGNSR